MLYYDYCGQRSESQTKDENIIALLDLIKELKVNLIELKELQTLYHNKNVKDHTYWPGDFIICFFC